MMKDTTKNRLNAAAAILSRNFAIAVAYDHRLWIEKISSLRDDIRSSITRHANQHLIQHDVKDISNICKTKVQLDYLTEKTVSEVKRLLGI